MINAKEAHRQAKKYNKDNSIKYAEYICSECEQEINKAIKKGLFFMHLKQPKTVEIDYKIVGDYLSEYFASLWYHMSIIINDYFYITVSW